MSVLRRELVKGFRRLTHETVDTSGELARRREKNWMDLRTRSEPHSVFKVEQRSCREGLEGDCCWITCAPASSWEFFLTAPLSLFSLLDMSCRLLVYLSSEEGTSVRRRSDRSSLASAKERWAGAV
eukprot:767851-Hanusia_phi.AAC.3